MSANKPNLLSTGQAAKFCSVTPDTVLKWIKKGRLRATRTAGGHYRIERRDLESLMASPSPGENPPQRFPECSSKSMHCWEYLGNRGAVRDECRQCVVYRVRATRCFLMAGLESEIGHVRRFCQTSCEDCTYYRRVKGLPANVLVITSDDELIKQLADEKNERIILRFARNAYQASAIIHDFRPALAVVDVESIPVRDTGILDSLASDSRVPGLRIAIVVPSRMTGRKRPRPKNDLVVGELEKPFGSRRIAAVIDSFPVDFLTPEDNNL
ncbi:MAG: MerR family transcriptional regulator [Planctomycetota bacterium]|jgi:excisionase family DNA binding protein